MARDAASDDGAEAVPEALVRPLGSACAHQAAAAPALAASDAGAVVAPSALAIPAVVALTDPAEPGAAAFTLTVLRVVR